MVVALLVAVAVGETVLSGALAALFVIASGHDGPLSERLAEMARFTLVGAILGGLAFWSADAAWAAAVVLGTAAYVGTIATVGGPSSAQAGLLLTLWALLALVLGGEGVDPWRVSVAFAVGGGIAIGITALRFRMAIVDTADDAGSLEAGGGAVPSRRRVMKEAVVGPIGRFALVRTAAVAAGVVLGYWWFPAYPLWVAITVIVVLQPSVDRSTTVAAQRVIGTALGVAVAVTVAQAIPRGDLAAVVALLVSGLLMLAFMGANYILFAAFLTAVVVFGEHLALGDFAEAGWERLLATAVGALIAVAAIAVRATGEDGAPGTPEIESRGS